MVTNGSADAVVHELDELIRDVDTRLPDVSGKDRLLRVCAKERSAMQRLASSSSTGIHEAVCSNLPHFKSIYRLAYTYRHRLIGLLWRYRLPPADSIGLEGSGRCRLSTSSPSSGSQYSGETEDCVSSGDDDHHEGLASERESCSLGLLPCQRRSSHILVDLICLQDESQARVHVGTCRAGNAPDAHLWAPLLWIKAVSRDADRLNSIWHGECLRTNTSCLSRQAAELASAAAWYQRDQRWSVGGIRPVIHWLPSCSGGGGGEPDLDRLDAGLLAALHRLRVSLVPGDAPVRGGGLNGAIDTGIASSVRQCMLSNMELRAVLLAPRQPGCCFREHKFDVLARLVEWFRAGASSGDPALSANRIDLEEQEQGGAGYLNVLLQQAVVYPYSLQVLERLDSLRRVNLDTTALISMVTEAAYFLPSGHESCNTVDAVDTQLLAVLSADHRRHQLLASQPFECANLDWHRLAEAEHPVLLSVANGIRDSVLIVCQTAVLSFIGIMAYIAGPREWLRGVHLVSRLAVLPDGECDDRSLPAPKQKLSLIRRRNKVKTKHIFDFGNSYNAVTMTSNSAYLRSLQQSGKRSTAIVIPARALTEEGMKGGKLHPSAQSHPRESDGGASTHSTLLEGERTTLPL